MKFVHIQAIGRSYGERHAIPMSAGQKSAKSDWLQGEGYHYYEQAIKGVVQSACDAIKDVMLKSSLTETDIDCVIFSTESYWENNFSIMRGADYPNHLKLREEILRTACDTLGLTNAVIYGNSFAACGNGFHALNIASAFIKSSQYKNVMVVNSDRLYCEKARASGSFVISDISTAIILNSSPGIISIRRHWVVGCNALIKLRNPQLPQEKSMIFIKAFQALKKRLSDIHDLDLSTYQNIVFENYGDSTVAVIARALGVAKETTLTPSKESCGHAFSSDLFLSMGLLQGQSEHKGKPLLFISIGTTSISLSDVILA